MMCAGIDSPATFPGPSATTAGGQHGLRRTGLGRQRPGRPSVRAQPLPAGRTRCGRATEPDRTTFRTVYGRPPARSRSGAASGRWVRGRDPEAAGARCGRFAIRRPTGEHARHGGGGTGRQPAARQAAAAAGAHVMPGTVMMTRQRGACHAGTGHGRSRLGGELQGRRRCREHGGTGRGGNGCAHDEQQQDDYTCRRPSHAFVQVPRHGSRLVTRSTARGGPFGLPAAVCRVAQARGTRIDVRQRPRAGGQERARPGAERRADFQPSARAAISRFTSFARSMWTICPASASTWR